MTDEQQARYVAALLEEKDGYERRGADDRVKAVEAELARMGYGSKVEKRPRKAPENRVSE